MQEVDGTDFCAQTDKRCVARTIFGFQASRRFGVQTSYNTGARNYHPHCTTFESREIGVFCRYVHSAVFSTGPGQTCCSTKLLCYTRIPQTTESGSCLGQERLEITISWWAPFAEESRTSHVNTLEHRHSIFWGKKIRPTKTPGEKRRFSSAVKKEKTTG